MRFIPVQADSEAGQEIGEDPGADDHACKHLVSDPLSVHSRVERVNGDGEHEKATADVARMEQPGLRKAWT